MYIFLRISFEPMILCPITQLKTHFPVRFLPLFCICISCLCICFWVRIWRLAFTARS